MKHTACVAFFLAAVLMAAHQSRAQTAADALSLAPKGELRVAFVATNSVLVKRDLKGEFSGVAIDLANALAAKLNVPLQQVPYESIERYNLSIGKDEWDVAIAPRDLSRVERLGFSEVLLTVDNGYVARFASSLMSADDVDRPGIKVAVAEHSAADSYLSRTLKKAQIVRLQRGLDEAQQALTIGSADVYADSIETAYLVAGQVPAATVLVGRFSSVPMTFAIPKSNVAALPLLNDFIDAARKDGTIANDIKHAGLRGVRLGTLVK